MRIVIDLQGAQTESRYRGIGRYSLAIAEAIARNAGKHDIWIVLNACMPDSITALKTAFLGLIPEGQIRIFDVPCDTAPGPWMIRASELIREAFIDSLQPDFVLVTSLFEGYWANAVTSINAIETHCQTAVILYDLIPLLNKELYLPSEELQEYYYKKVFWLKKADLLLAISESSRQEGVEHLGFPSEKIANISASIDQQFHPLILGKIQAKTLLSSLSISRKPVLYVPGGVDPRKNFARLIEAYSMLEQTLRKQYQLVIASKMSSVQQDELSEHASHFGLEPGEMVLTGYLEDQDLIALYSLAEVFVFPSMHEGFGLPVLEAMACGAPVIGSNSSSIPEVIGFSEALFDPLSVKSIMQKLKEVITDGDFRSRLKKHAQLRAKKFSWDVTAKKAIKALEAIDASRKTTNVPQIAKDTLIETLVSISDEMPTDDELFQIASCIAYNVGIRAEKQLMLDVSTIVHSDAKSGIQRVVRSLLKELLKNPPNGTLVRLIYFDVDKYRYANNFTTKITKTKVEASDLPIDYYQDDIYLSLDLNMHLSAQLHPLHERMHSMGVKLNFIIYDLLLINRPDWWVAPNPKLFKEWLKNVSTVGDNLVCISRAVAVELQSWLDQNQLVRDNNKPVVSSFHLGADINNSIPTTGLHNDSNLILNEISLRPSFLMVGTIEPRKGHSQTLAAFERLWSEGVETNLVIVGKEGWKVERLVGNLRGNSRLGKHLFWLEGISDEFLDRIYECSTCLIAASEGEGFGLPLIEAAQHHLPIIARDLPVFREVADKYAYYFKGREPEALAETIKQWLTLNSKDKAPGSSEMPWLTWKQSTEQLVKIVLANDLVYSREFKQM